MGILKASKTHANRATQIFHLLINSYGTRSSSLMHSEEIPLVDHNEC